MILPEHLVTLLYHARQYDEINHKVSFDYVNAHKEGFIEILHHVSEFESQYILAQQNMKKIHEIFARNNSEDICEYCRSFIDLLQFTVLGAPSDFTFFDSKISRKRYTSLTDIWEATIIYQSVTGLYERRVEVRKLWDGERL